MSHFFKKSLFSVLALGLTLPVYARRAEEREKIAAIGHICKNFEERAWGHTFDTITAIYELRQKYHLEVDDLFHIIRQACLEQKDIRLKVALVLASVITLLEEEVPNAPRIQLKDLTTLSVPALLTKYKAYIAFFSDINSAPFSLPPLLSLLPTSETWLRVFTFLEEQRTSARRAVSPEIVEEVAATTQGVLGNALTDLSLLLADIECACNKE